MGAELLPYEVDSSGVVTMNLTRDDKTVVVLNRALLESIDATLDQLAAEVPDPAGFVLASGSARVFIAGADLKEVVGLSDDDLLDYLAFGQKVYSRIASLPCTSVAAINGACLGGGLEIAMHCDTLIGAKTERVFPIGLPEAGLGICPGWGGTNLLPARMDPEKAILRTATGQTMTSAEALQDGLLSELVEPDQLLSRARELAKVPKVVPMSNASVTPRCISNEDVKPHVRATLNFIGNDLPDTEAAKVVIGCVQKGLVSGWEDALEMERTELTRLRSTDQAKKAIQAFFEKSSKPKPAAAATGG